MLQPEQLSAAAACADTKASKAAIATANVTLMILIPFKVGLAFADGRLFN
jgi:hypothetical protein